jgi:putative colanic acid biosynthesis acetyltransferase WcaB
LGYPIVICYKIFVEWILSVELQVKTNAGPGLVIYHGQGLVVSDQTKIGKNVTLRHNTTIGNKQNTSGGTTSSPIIGDNVDIGSNCVIIGDISIGANAVIGAGAVVVTDVPENAVMSGNPAKVIKIKE